MSGIDLQSVAEKLADPNLSEISNLIQIRNYVQASVNNYGINKSVVADLNVMVILLDKLIVDKLMSQDFKTYVKFEDKDKAVAEVAKITNIKSSLPRSSK